MLNSHRDGAPQCTICNGVTVNSERVRESGPPGWLLQTVTFLATIVPMHTTDVDFFLPYTRYLLYCSPYNVD
jgi:hypothetical protein